MKEMTWHNKRQKRINGIGGGVFLLFLVFLAPNVKAQVHIPVEVQTFSHGHHPISVKVIQELRFGALAPGASGGTVTISANGSRSSTGRIFLAGGDYSCGIIRIEAPRKTLINIVPANTSLKYRGYRLALTFSSQSDVSPRPPFLTHSLYTDIRIGGTLHSVGKLEPGNYNGRFLIRVTQR